MTIPGNQRDNRDADREVPIELWGRRLSDAIRAAIGAGDLGGALQLARTGDGLTRSLDTEYTLMLRGLGITVRVILDELPGPDPQTARRGPGDLVRQFRQDLTSVAARVFDAAPPPFDAAPAGYPEAKRSCSAALDWVERTFDRDQRRTARAIETALERGDTATALTLLARKETGQFVPLHDRIIQFMAESFAWVHQSAGPAALSAFHLRVAGGQRAGFDKWESMTARELAKSFTFLLKQHMGQVSVYEEHDRFVIDQSLCGSGGRLLAAGAYAGERGLPYVPTRVTPDAGTVSQLPVYCSHCPMWNTFAPINWYGHPHLVFAAPARPDGACTIHLPKRSAFLGGQASVVRNREPR